MKNTLIMGAIFYVVVMSSSCTAYLEHIRQIGHPPKPEQPMVQIKDDQFERSATIVGIDVVTGLNDENYHRYFLRSWVDKQTFAVTHQLYVNLHYRGDWKFFRSVSSQDAKPLKFIRVRRDVITCRESGYYGCWHVEDFGAIIDHRTLQEHRDVGYSVKFHSRFAGDELIIAVSSEQIQRQLDAVESYVKGYR